MGKGFARIFRVALVAGLTLAWGCARPGRTVTFLAVNDIYRIEGVDGGRAGGLARLRTVRRELEAGAPDLLLLHAGDALYPSLPSRLYKGGQMIDVLNRLDGDPEAEDPRFFITFGNHEFDADRLGDAAQLDGAIEASQFRWLSANLEFAEGDDGAPLVAAPNLLDGVVVDAGGVRVGIFGLTTDMKVPEYVEAVGDPESVALAKTRELRSRGAELVVALTHLSIDQDAAILADLGQRGPDVIFGGHEHDSQERRVGGRWVLKADADARSATVARVRPRRHRPPKVDATLRVLDQTVAEDPEVRAAVDGWLARFDREFCAKGGEPAGCLDEELAPTAVLLEAEELKIRRFETNYGDWILDRALEALEPRGAQVAFVNSGSLRLNQDIAAGTVLTRRALEETFAYPTPLLLLRLRGSDLQAVVSHAVSEWTGNGHWLQIAGFAFVHDPDAGTAGDLTLLTPDGPRPIAPDEEILAVTDGYLVDPRGDRDGYTMLGPERVVPGDGPPPDLKLLVLDALRAAGETGIAPRVEGRIYNRRRPGPCLAAAGTGISGVKRLE